MNLKGIACGFAVVAALVASVYFSAHTTNNNPVVNAKFAASTLIQPVISPIAVSKPSVHNTIGADTVGFYGQSLMSTSDAHKRIELIRALGSATLNRNKTGVGLREPQTVEILAAAYGRESEPAVKIEIVNAVSEFNVPEAAELLNRAIADTDRTVRQAAQEAKTRREIRQLFANCCE
jgi:hypothetical protein